MMSGIRNKNTRHEVLIRKILHHHGFRYKLHDKSFPGKPDLVLPKYKAVIFVNGCFWHVHDCHLFKWPSTRKEFWQEKLASNKERDEVNLEKYQHSGWKVLVIWECALKGKTRLRLRDVIYSTINWLRFDNLDAEITGQGVFD